ncbi:hypothetical protein Mapa_014371 [Marchantia paleacea]|nr:hypothetical protein Mapa_014371 [Marchantia paleacea]
MLTYSKKTGRNTYSRRSWLYRAMATDKYGKACCGHNVEIWVHFHDKWRQSQTCNNTTNA